MGKTEFNSVVMNEDFQFMLELINPVHRVQLRKAGVLFRILDVR
jgi:hypothetical protein